MKHINILLTAICVYNTGDIGKIIGKGKTIHKARSDASIQCFEKRANLAEKYNKLTDNKGLDIIDSCINIKCQ